MTPPRYFAAQVLWSGQRESNASPSAWKAEAPPRIPWPLKKAGHQTVSRHVARTCREDCASLAISNWRADLDLNQNCSVLETGRLPLSTDPQNWSVRWVPPPQPPRWQRGVLLLNYTRSIIFAGARRGWQDGSRHQRPPRPDELKRPRGIEPLYVRFAGAAISRSGTGAHELVTGLGVAPSL